MKRVKLALKRAFPWAYSFSLLASMAFIFFYSHDNNLRPGFILMLFAMKTFFWSFLLGLLFFGVGFFLFQSNKTT